ncbi:MAG: hypothetical protein A2504_10575 [Bdellovibrionales bacterium RIFOXYD12_FULL_39_22]|nr:MAG: hypothetical protein A2385_14210 [Bdellovibrionales bacterium RIFOXYB1_FULL_39_21]OFZ40389.1 MAG: hypothetical protein A2485_02900 [Bdellovibrionales bacterium RIFOXYC12_FULL_39_17]OFZ49638.1 MAG: hypothetical protein A2404_09360 [Bdellovibrionales bacterium RIFOXYC1_FULL_39_130]OFZ77308.1 MAG: hypothetical protein A2560_06025 [Bdellovibrionales bacterium RIFOXYD1_FULL_39_84]OFZ95963.1 MAG: hypothetical protein A2504_10575 [Bdellovibrionales bacterium RIFOXYD12_FULL_39_22]HLE11224.1 hy
MSRYLLIAFILFSNNFLFGKDDKKIIRSPNSTEGFVTCGGKSKDTTIKIDFCYTKSRKSENEAYTKKCTGDNGRVFIYINNELDYNGYVPSKLAVFPDEMAKAIFLTVLNDGQETNTDIYYTVSEHEEEWNTIKTTSVKTGKKYLITDFACTVNN